MPAMTGPCLVTDTTLGLHPMMWYNMVGVVSLQPIKTPVTSVQSLHAATTGGMQLTHQALHMTCIQNQLQVPSSYVTPHSTHAAPNAGHRPLANNCGWIQCVVQVHE